MPEMMPVPKDHPLMIAWEEYQRTEDFSNSMKWAAIGQQYLQGSMWAAFMAGFNTAAAPGSGDGENVTALTHEIAELEFIISKMVDHRSDFAMNKNAAIALLDVMKGAAARILAVEKEKRTLMRIASKAMPEEWIVAALARAKEEN